ncbi:DNA replication/repair protein RecF [Thiofilum flexile]|uniref:DNA replication/repair protein RecF n=1 Tax=Thiofilum flexile TaxID=125627 RepID=UPI00036004C9|nr:DNA replication and repair protein RecF [Thiofilum flexile]
MYLEQITIENCRSIRQATLGLSPRVNFIRGNNAAGKSSILEAIHILSTGRSFRTPRIQEVIQQGKNHVLVAAKLISESYSQTYPQGYPLGIQKTPRTTHIRINHQDVKQQAELTRHLPFAIIHPETLSLITGGPAIRRALVDWIAFYRDAEFHELWRQYQRVLQQRNACLRDSAQRYALGYWTEQLIKLVPILHQKRFDALKWLGLGVEHYKHLIASMGLIELKLSTGFPAYLDTTQPQEMLYFLQSKQQQEMAQGFSLYGAHRVDLHIQLAGQLAERVASRGELKLLSIAFLLAKSYAIADQAPERGLIGVDDLAAELDDTNQLLLYETLLTTQQQLVITGTRLPTLINPAVTPASLFTVQQGVITPESTF